MISMESNKNIIKQFFRQILLIRRFEERICAIYRSDVVKSPVHLSIGQEAVAVGICAALRADDLISNTYRCHATHIAKGGDLKAMMAELFGKQSGCAGGKAGSMHLVEIDKGILGASAVVATTIPVAAGYALVLKREGKGRIIVSMFGDGATEEGVFSETINFAALHRLPMIFVCENNRLAIHSRLEQRWASAKLCARVETYGIRTMHISSGDVLEIFAHAQEAAELVRGGNGPVFMEIDTYRMREHVGIAEDMREPYRDRNEYERWKDKDPLTLLAKEFSSSEISAFEKEVEEKINAAIAFAEASSFPDENELMKNVYA